MHLFCSVTDGSGCYTWLALWLRRVTSIKFLLTLSAWFTHQGDENKGWRWSITEEALDFLKQILHVSTVGKFIENSMDNMHSGVRVLTG